VYFFFHRYFYLRDPADKKKQNPRFQELGIPTQKSVGNSRFSGIFGNRDGRIPGIFISVNIAEIRYRIQYDKF